MGHTGTSKTKELLRKKYWFPEMNIMVENIVGRCYDCQVATKSHRSEPLKTTNIPEEACKQLQRTLVDHTQMATTT